MMNRAFSPQSSPHRWLGRSLILSWAIAPVVAALPPITQAIAAPPTHITQAPPAPTRPTLRVGSTGSAVSEIQALLLLLGYFDGPVDGQYQATTATAVNAFQADVGLQNDGVAGPATWDKLLPSPSTEFTPPEVPAEPVADTRPEADEAEEADPPVALPILREGMSGPAVSRVQETLKTRGFYEGAIDGLFGPATAAAVMDFQKSVQLAADGVIGPATWQALLQQ